jgi:hypothetical protein
MQYENDAKQARDAQMFRLAVKKLLVKACCGVVFTDGTNTMIASNNTRIQ